MTRPVETGPVVCPGHNGEAGSRQPAGETTCSGADIMNSNAGCQFIRKDGTRYL
jgi:hypothetical protein